MPGRAPDDRSGTPRRVRRSISHERAAVGQLVRLPADLGQIDPDLTQSRRELGADVDAAGALRQQLRELLALGEVLVDDDLLLARLVRHEAPEAMGATASNRAASNGAASNGLGVEAAEVVGTS